MVGRRDAKDWARQHMKGLWTSPMIPFSADFKLDEAGVRNNVDYMIGAKADGIGMGFSEPWVMTLAERKRLMEVSIDAVGKRVPAYLHSSDHSVEETINLTQHARDVGADAVMIWTPYEWAKSQSMIIDYFTYVASKVDIAIFAYNTYHSGTAMTPETVDKLAAIEGICALKDAINDVGHAVRCVELAGDRIVVSDPLEDHLLTMTLHFNQQIMLGTTSVFLMQSPDCQPIRDYYLLAKAGKAAEAAKKYYELQPLRDIWTGIYSVLWDKKAAAHPLPLIKYWMELNGMAAGPVRPPMHNLTAEQKAAFRQRLENAGGWYQKVVPKAGAAERKRSAAE
jgi:4-hydroxy-tetrahydrodipicolinate synthase